MTSWQKRFEDWEPNEIERAVQLIREDAESCGIKQLPESDLVVILERLPLHYFFNRNKRAFKQTMKKFQPSFPDSFVGFDIDLLVERTVDRWVNLVTSNLDDAQEEAKIFIRTVRLKNSYLWYLSGKKIASIYPELEAIFWRLQNEPFK